VAAPLRTRSNAELCAEADALQVPLVGEVIAGVLYTMGRPTPAHANIEAGLILDLRGGPRGGGPPPSGWYIQAEVEVRFPNDEKAIPDLSGWHSDRIAGHRNDNPIRIVPDWVCEILSESTRAKDLGPKRDLYARHGVKHLWIVEPDAHLLEAFALGASGRWELIGTWTENAVAAVAPFEGCALSLDRWWLKDE
jgi:Uma2 family endonuclease